MHAEKCIQEEVHAMVTGGLEKISESLQLAESKKNNLEKSILSLVDQWKDLEGDLDLAQKDFCEGLRELDTKEQRLSCEKESLELRRQWIEQRVREIRDREGDFALFRHKKMRDLERRERDFDRMRELYGKSVCEPLGVQEKRVEGLLETLKSEKLEMEGLKTLLEKRFNELGLEEEAMKNKRKDVEMIEISIEKRTRELKHNEEKVKEREKQVELKEEHLNLWKERQIETELKERQLQLTIEDIEFQEKKIDFIRKLNEKQMVELDLKEKHLKEKEVRFEKEILEKGLKDLESQKKGFGEEIKEFELRKKELEQSLLEFHSKNKDLLSQKKLLEEESGKRQQEKEEFHHRVKQFELAERELQKSLKEFDLEKKESLTRTQLLEMESKDLESKWRKFERRIVELNMREKVLEKSFQDLHLKEKLIEEDYKHLESKKKELEESIKKFELKEKELGLNEKKIESEKKLLEKDSKHLESKRKELDESIKKFEYSDKEFALNYKKIESEKKLLEKDSKHLESGKKELEEKIKNFGLRLKEFELREEKLESGKKLIEKDSKNLESRRKELEERIQKLELREKQLYLKGKQLSGAAHLKIEPGCDPVNHSLSSNDIDLKFVALIMGGKHLQIFLNEREKDHHLMAGEILKAFQLSKDPAKLVLDAMEGFFPPHLNRGNGEFSSDVIRRSCMLLLQQLIKISPQIQPCVRDDALKLAREWKAKLTIDCSLEVSSFLYLLGTYNLASAFDAEEIMSFLKSISKHQEKLEPQLCGRLDLKEKIPSVIENLLKSNQRLEAIKFIYGFELVDCFPPVPILKNYLKHVKMYAHTMLIKREREMNAQNELIDTRIAALRRVIKCIVDYKLESEYSTKDLENSIKQLLMQKNNKEMKGSSNSKVEVQQISSTAPPNQPKSQSCAPSSQPKAQSSNILRGPSPPMAVIIANMDRKNLLSFLSSYLSEHELLRNEISSALLISRNSPKLVLDAVENLYDSHLTDEESKSCILLLEQLLGLSPDIMPDVKEAAQNIAFNWQVKLKARNGNSLLTLAYLLLISAYRLDSTLHRDELLNLYQMVAEQKPSPTLSEALGVSKDISSAAPLQSQVETEKATSRCMLANNLMPSTSMVPGLDAQQSRCTNMDLEGKECVSVHTEVPTFISLSSDPAGLILDAIRNCHRSNFFENKNPLSIAKSFYHLLEHLTAVSPEIKPKLKERAYEFFLEWTAKSIGSHNIWETRGLLQLIAAYQLSSSISSDQIFGLLEVVYPPKKVASFIRMFGLVDKVPDFISKLIGKKKLLVSFDYVYEFSLADMFPLVALLKQYVRYSKVAAKKIFFKGHKTTDALDKSMESEISALKNVLRLITRHKLESEYPANEIISTIKDLEIQRANLKKTQMQKQKVDPEVQINNKRRWPTSDSVNEATNLQPASKFRRLVSKSGSQNQIPMSQHPGDGNMELYVQSYLRTPSGHYNLTGGAPPLVCPPQNEFLPSNHNASVYNYIPPLWMDGKESLNTGWRNHSSRPHHYQRTH